MRAADRPNRQQSGGAGSQDAIPDISDFSSWAVLILPSEKILLLAFLDELLIVIAPLVYVEACFHKEHTSYFSQFF